MPNMISAEFAEKVIIREMGVNHVKGVELQKMTLDHKSVKATIKSGPAKVEFVIQEEKPTFKVTGEDIPGEMYLQFLENMHSMVDEIFNQDGDGLYDYNRRTGEAEVKEKFVADEPQPIEQRQIETKSEIIEAEFTEVEELFDASEFEMSEEEVLAEVIDVVGEGNVIMQESIETAVEELENEVLSVEQEIIEEPIEQVEMEAFEIEELPAIVEEPIEVKTDIAEELPKTQDDIPAWSINPLFR